ncbi:MAG TPA: hypothetical protein DDZ67_10875 [Xanthomonadaceae bacterium]|nr:hypothetical protein [Xanthomonadaceae bacterium]
MKRIIGAFLALSLLATGSAFAAPPHDDRDQDRREHRDERDQRGPARHDEHRAPPHHQRGERLAQDHRGERVPDYRKHGLKKPPKGHEWRKVDNQYVLIAVATGVIASVIANAR